MAELEQSNPRTADSHLNKILSENRYGSKTSGKQDADYWMERLNAIKVRSLDIVRIAGMDVNEFLNFNATLSILQICQKRKIKYF